MSDFMDSLEALAREKKIDRGVLLSTIEAALVTAYKRNYSESNVNVQISETDQMYHVYSRRIVVENVSNPTTDISLESARQINPKNEIGDIVEIEVTPSNFGRIASMAAKQVIVQKIREAEHGVIFNEFSEKENEILTAIVDRVEEDGSVLVELGKTQGLLNPANQMPGETLAVNDHIKVYVLEALRDAHGPQVLVSRTHPGLVKRLFELEVPEIRDGTVLIKSIAREAGARTKMAVWSQSESVDPVGSCVGPRGMRVENVVQELKDEKIDIIKWSSDPAEYIANALNPARVLNVYVSEREKTARVIVPDNQLSLAIGKEGQNARLAARLTGWRIDIKSQTQAEDELLGADDAPQDDQDIDPAEDLGEDPDIDLDQPLDDTL